MHMTRTSALLAGATPLALLSGVGGPLAPERKDTANLPIEVKTAVDDLTKLFTGFREKNDDRLKQLEKKGEDAVTRAEVEKLNTGIDELKTAVQKQLDEVFTKANRERLAGGDGGDPELKSVAAFQQLLGKSDYTVEQFREYKSDLDHFLRRNEAKSTLMVGSDPAGGYLVTPDVSGRMVQRVYETTPMRQLATVVSIGSDSLQGPIDNGEGDAAWVGETEERKQTNLPGMGMWEIPVHELYAYPKATQKLLEDARINIEAWIAEKSTSKFSRKESSAFTNGDGVRKPRGLFNYDVVATDDATRAWGKFQFVKSGHASQVNNADALLDLIFELKSAYRQNARFMGSRHTMRDLRKLKDGDGNYLVGLRLADGALVETVFGFGYVDGEDAPAIAANATPLAFGDFAETYTIVDRLGVSVIRDNITQPGFVKWNMRKRVGGGAINFESMKFLKIAA